MKKCAKCAKKAIKVKVKIAVKKMKPGNKKFKKVLKEFKHGSLHSGSKKGPKVKKRSQAIAIALNEAKRKVKG